MSEIIFVWYNGGKEVELAGTFNHWSPQGMTKQGNKFFLKLSLPDGYYQYKFVVDGKWVYDLREPSVDDGSGNWNNFIEIGKRTHHAPAESKKEVHHQQHQQHPKKEQQPKKEQPPKKQQQQQAQDGQDKPLSKKQQKKANKQQKKSPHPHPEPEPEPEPVAAEAEAEPAPAPEAETEAPAETEAEPAVEEEEAAPAPAAEAKKEKATESIATLEVVGADVDTDLEQLEQFVRSQQPAGLSWEGSSVSEHFFGLKKISIICRVKDDVSLEELCAEMEKNEALVGSASIANFSC